MSEIKKVFCTECGAENDGNFKFCSSCGSKLEVPVEEPTVSSMVETPIMDALAAEAAESSYSEETTPYSAGVPYENTYGTESTEYASSVSEDIQINYSQDDGSFSGNVYDSQPQYYTAEPVAEKKGMIGFSIASLICGILAVVCCCLGCISLVLAIAAVALGIVTIACKYDGKGMAVAGIVLGGVGVILFIITIIIGTSDGYTEMMEELMNEFY